jgi:hypothetical protein
MDDFGWLMQRIFGRFIGPTDEPGASSPADPEGHSSKDRPLSLAAE